MKESFQQPYSPVRAGPEAGLLDMMEEYYSEIGRGWWVFRGCGPTPVDMILFKMDGTEQHHIDVKMPNPLYSNVSVENGAAASYDQLLIEGIVCGS